MARKPKTPSEETSMQAEIADTVSDSTNVAQAHADDYNRSRCGGALRQAREAQGLTVQDVASKLRLGPKQIEAIEADNFAKLPEPTIVRGFIRNYAKLLKINAEPLLDAYTVIVPSNTQHQLTVKPSSNMQVTSGDKPKPSSYIWAGLFALLALGAWLFYQSYIAKPSPIKPSANVEVLEPLPEPALPAAERAPDLQTSTEITLPPAADATGLPAPAAATLPAPVETPPTAPSSIPATITPNAPPVSAMPVEAAPAVAPAGMSKLEFNATQETWVSVADDSGREIFNKIIFAGSRESLDITPPVNVTVGNAGATSISMNGKPVELAPHMRGNVARLKLE